ncbi:MAG: hypothetical protein LUD12_02830 [Lachnospiraceae bacterium]|nr:hypothetical protein [Lachnospiraceae bacterium]
MDGEIECTAGTSGWVKLYRDVMDNDVWKDKPFARGQAWVDLIMLANHKDKEFWFNASCLCIQRGQFVTSKRKLGERWGWSVCKVTKFLTELEKVGMVTAVSDHKKTIISVTNYAEYQGNSERTVSEQSKNSERTVKEQQANTEKTLGKQRANTERKQSETNKNINNLEEGKKEKSEEEPAALSSSEDGDLELGFNWDEVESE